MRGENENDSKKREKLAGNDFVLCHGVQAENDCFGNLCHYQCRRRNRALSSRVSNHRFVFRWKANGRGHLILVRNSLDRLYSQAGLLCHIHHAGAFFSLQHRREYAAEDCREIDESSAWHRAEPAGRQTEKCNGRPGGNN